MFSIFKTFSWTALVSVLSYAFFDSPEIFYLTLNQNEHKDRIEVLNYAFEEMSVRDQILIQRLNLKNQVFNAFKQGEISIYEAASCFQTMILHCNDKKQIIPYGHESYGPNIRACLGLLLWLKDPEFKGTDFEVVINDFSDVVNIAKNGGYEIKLPTPPAKLLADFLY
jgi:phenylalanyl-tRNA synthetase beta subunit